MNPDYVIVTDSGCDLSDEMLAALGIPAVPLNVFMKDSPAQPCTLHGVAFYAALQRGQTACTSAANLSAFREAFVPILAAGKDVLYIAFSSALSSMFATAQLAASELAAEYPDRKIIVIDSLSASLGQGLLVYHAAEQRERGMTLTELAAFVTAERQRIAHWFTVDDLMFLRRGGRVSGISAVAGTLLGIKPVMRCSSEGKLTVFSKARGRRAALLALASHFESECSNRSSTVFIGHADAQSDAEYLRDVLQKAAPDAQIVIGEIGAVIGAHAGPGTVALFYPAASREVVSAIHS